MEKTGCNVGSDSSVKVKEALLEAEMIEVAAIDKWRLPYLSVLLQQRHKWHY